MDIHKTIKEVLSKYGIELVRSDIFVNYLADANCFNEFRSAKGVLKEILSIYGESFYDLKVNQKPYQDSLLKYKSDFARSRGYQLELVNYLFDSITYGLGWVNNVDSSLKKLRETHLTLFHEKNAGSHFWFYAHLYHYYDINVTRIRGKVQDVCDFKRYDSYELSSDEIYYSFKEPKDPNWKKYIDEIQDIKYINDQDWDDATGIGMIAGFSQLRALDFDYVSLLKNFTSKDLDRYICNILKLLNLPKDYHWVTRSGSGTGIHIIFRCEDVSDFDCFSVSFRPSKAICKKGEGFERLELRWRDHLVLPPSRPRGYYIGDFREPECESYRFYSGHFPYYSPMVIEIDKLNNLLNYFTSEITYVAHVGSASILGHSKLTTKFSSFGYYEEFKTTENWAKKCSTNDYEEYVNYLLRDTYKKPERIKKAVEILKDSNTAISHYNLASLISHNKIAGNKEEAMSHYTIASKCKDLESYLSGLKFDIDRME